jgi:hypothetical protein
MIPVPHACNLEVGVLEFANSKSYVITFEASGVAVRKHAAALVFRTWPQFSSQSIDLYLANVHAWYQ